MSESGNGLRVGHPVPNFELATYDPVKEDFGTIQPRWSEVTE